MNFNANDRVRSARSSTDATTLHPNSMDGGLSPAAMMASPSDMVGPSPVTSNGTETTEIEDDASEEAEAEAQAEAEAEEAEAAKRPESVSLDISTQYRPSLTGCKLNMLNTSLPAQFRTRPDDEPPSVIHAPQGYMTFVSWV